MAWIEFHESARTHWKIARLAKQLGISYAHALGLCACLWTWAVSNARQGDLSHFSDEELAEACRWERNGNAVVTPPVTLLSVLKACQLVDDDGKVHDWDEFRLHYELMEARRERQMNQVRNRVRRFRLRQKAARDGNADVTAPVTQPATRSNAPTGPHQPNQTTQKKEMSPWRSLKDSPSPTHQALGRFNERFTELVGDPYPASLAKDLELFKKSIHLYGFAKVADLIDIFFEQAQTGTTWHADKLTVGVWYTKLPELVISLSKERRCLAGKT